MLLKYILLKYYTKQLNSSILFWQQNNDFFVFHFPAMSIRPGHDNFNAVSHKRAGLRCCFRI